MSKDFLKADPAEGSREIIERELARRDVQSSKTKHGAEADSGRRLTSNDVAAAVRDADDHLIAFAAADCGARICFSTPELKSPEGDIRCSGRTVGFPVTTCV